MSNVIYLYSSDPAQEADRIANELLKTYPEQWYDNPTVRHNLATVLIETWHLFQVYEDFNLKMVIDKIIDDREDVKAIMRDKGYMD